MAACHTAMLLLMGGARPALDPRKWLFLALANRMSFDSPPPTPKRPARSDISKSSPRNLRQVHIFQPYIHLSSVLHTRHRHRSARLNSPNRSRYRGNTLYLMQIPPCAFRLQLDPHL